MRPVREAHTSWRSPAVRRLRIRGKISQNLPRCFSVFLTPAFQLAFALAVGQDGFAAIEASSRLLIKFFLYSILTCFCACGFGGALRFFVKWY